MTMTIPTATARLGRQIGEAHAKIDEALVSVAALFASAAQARADIEADPVLGQRALMRMHKSAGSLLSLRADMFRVHSDLKQDLRVVSGAEEPTCPDNSFFITGYADDERVVA
jgi:hypothetical protein